MIVSYRTPAVLLSVYERVIWPAMAGAGRGAQRMASSPDATDVRLLAFVHRFHAAHGFGPTVSETANALICSRRRILQSARQLAENGYLCIDRRKSRGFAPVTDQVERSGERGRSPSPPCSNATDASEIAAGDPVSPDARPPLRPVTASSRSRADSRGSRAAGGQA